MDACLAATGTNIWLAMALGVLLLGVGLAGFFYKPLRKKLGLVSSVLAIGGVVLLGTPTYAADGVDCNTEQRQAPVVGGPPSPPSGPPVTSTAPVAVKDDLYIWDFACNGPESTVSSVSMRSATTTILDNDNAQSPNTLDPASVDLDPQTAGVQHSLTLAHGALEYDPATREVTYTPNPDYQIPLAIGDECPDQQKVDELEESFEKAFYTMADNTGNRSNQAEIHFNGSSSLQ